jgi:hypothetical protein
MSGLRRGPHSGRSLHNVRHGAPDGHRSLGRNSPDTAKDQEFLHGKTFDVNFEKSAFRHWFHGAWQNSGRNVSGYMRSIYPVTIAHGFKKEVLPTFGQFLS